ncbi:MAG: DsbA family protein [Sphingomonadaceae bacterium]
MRDGAARPSPDTGVNDGNEQANDKGLAFRSAIANDPVAPKYAPGDFDVTVIVYSDYQCPYCRKLHPELERLIGQDKRVRIVYRDWPIFGAGSVEAARAAIASQWQGKHAAFDDALMTTGGRLNSAKIKAAAIKAGVNWTRLQRDLRLHKADIDGLLARTNRQAETIGLQGTPAILIGPYFASGTLTYSQLIQAVALARKFNRENPKAALKQK